MRYFAGDDPRYVTVGDLNGDGDLDLALANWISDDISILLNNGYGTFQDAESYDAGNGPVTVILGDLDADGDLDAGVASEHSDAVSILINDSDGKGTPRRGIELFSGIMYTKDHRLFGRIVLR